MANEHFKLEIPLSELNEAWEALLSHVKASAGDRPVIHTDYYWSIPPAEASDVSRQPSTLTIGQITECLENLGKVIEAPEDAISYALVWLGDVLRILGGALVT